MTESKWHAFYTQYAIDFIAQNITSERVLRKIFKYRELIEEFPDMGRPYDPSYPAAKTPFPCREIAVPDTPFNIYYMKQEESRRIVIFCVEFQRVDPNGRFSKIDYDIIDW